MFTFSRYNFQDGPLCYARYVRAGYELWLALNRVLNVLSIVGCLCLLVFYFKAPEKALGLKLVAILSASDLCFHSAVFFPRLFDATLLGWMLEEGSFYFSGAWTATMSLIIMRALRSMQFFKQELNLHIGLWFIPPCILTIVALVLDKSLGSYSLGTILIILFFIVNVLFTVRSFCIIKSYSVEYTYLFQKTTIILSIYPLMQVVVFGTLAVQCFLHGAGKYELSFGYFLISLPSTLGLANSVLFFIQWKLTSAKQDDDPIKSLEISLN